LIGWLIARSADKRRSQPPEDEDVITWQAVIESRRN
jgi:putrescine transport system permease protein